MKSTIGEQTFYVVNYIMLAVLGFVTVYPFLYVFAASLSSAEAVVTGKVLLFPKDITFESYRRVLSEEGIWIAYANTMYYTVVGTAANLLFTVLGAYPLSKKRVMGRTWISFMIAFTMLFNAGMIPMFLNINQLGLMNTRTSIIIAFAVSTWLVIIMRTFFQSIPDEMEEAAKVDGASDMQILWRIYLPLSVPALVAISLFYAVGRWNSYFWAMVLLRDENKVPLQVLLKRLIVEMNPTEEMMAATDVAQSFSQETVIYATIIVSILPIIVIYPLIQKHFVKGVMIGSLKG
jgi:putative aldouronate transport system permease protein